MQIIAKPSPITSIPPADSSSALAHFSGLFRFETDCSDVHAASANEQVDFVLLDVRSPELYAQGHVDGAVNVPHRKIVSGYMDARWPQDTVFVVYCNGTHCNGAQRAAVRLAELRRPVKLMVGGISGWLDEGYTLTK